MPCFMIIPAIGWAWPALLPIVAGVASALGYQTFSDPKGILRGRVTGMMEKLRIETVALDAVQAEIIAEEFGNEERLTFRKDDMVLVFRKDARGKFFIDVVGPKEKTALDLKIRGEEFAQGLVKKFAYHKIVEQLSKINAEVISEKVEANGAVELEMRRWK